MSNFTPEQQKIIDRESGNLVVTASAGSGKTSVMTERFISLVLKGRASVDEILCVTFTRLAADELKTRLSKALRKAMLAADDPHEAARLRAEIDKLPSAAVSTVDSFCNTLVKKYFYVAGVDPQFSIIDENASQNLKKVALDEVFERLYEQNDEGFLLLLQTLIRKRSDKRLRETVLNVSEFISCEADGEKFLENALSAYTPEGVKNAVNGLIDLFIEKMRAFLKPLLYLERKSEELGQNSSAEYLFTLGGEISALAANPSKEGFFAFASAKRTKPPIRANGDERLTELSEQIRGVNDTIKDITKKFFGYLRLDDYEARSIAAGSVLSSLKRVVGLFDSEYAEMKREIAALDYSDLEHFAYKILCAEDVLADIKKEYKYIFVDEYQDTNGIQEAIFSKLSDGNLFIVGDEKQSIYGFRGCDSSIFENRVACSSSDEVISLDKNFRSTRAVVNAVNNIFCAAMTVRTAGKDYSLHPMIYGGLYEKTAGRAAIVRFEKDAKVDGIIPDGVYSVEKHLALLKQAPDGQEEKAVEQIITQVVGTRYTITDRDGNDVEKTVGFGDIAVLTRTGKGAVDKIVSRLTSSGIPVISDSKRSIGDYPEIKTVVAVLDAIVYSGKEDFSLATALRSPVGGLSDEQLLYIRQHTKQDFFYDAVREYREKYVSDEIAVKLNDFFNYLERLSLIAQYEGVAEVVKKIVSDKMLDVHFLTQTLGELKVRRLERFIAETENGGRGMTLQQFFDSKDAILENMTISFADGNDAVRVMDIHQSKGLEFPIVILCELKRNFYHMDRSEQITMSRRYGIGLKYYDIEKKLVYPTVIKNYIDASNEANTLREEARLFYVATTRAKHSLYMLTSVTPVAERLGYEAENACCFNDLLCKTDCEYIDLSDFPEAQVTEKTEQRRVIFADSPDPEKVEGIKKFVAFSYPYADDVNVSVKKTVTEISHSAAEAEEGLLPVQPIVSGGSVESGNAYHKFLQFSALDKGLIEKDLEKIAIEGLMDESELGALDISQLEKILSSPVFSMLGGYKLYREQPFIVNLPAQMAGENGKAEVLVQGVIDLLAVKGDKAVIVDYKYSGRSAEALVATYKKQLELYAYATEKVLKIKVEERYLFNIKTCEIIKL